MKYRPRHVIEYAAVRALAWIMNALPYRAALFVGWLLAGLAFHVIRFRRRETERRIRQVFGGDYPAAAVRRIAWQSLRNLAFTTVDAMRGPALTLARFRATTDTAAVERLADPLRRQIATGRGAIVASPHFGWWELGAPALALCDIPIFAIAAKQRNPLFDAYLNRTRAAMGMEIILRGTAALRGTLGALQAGKVLVVLPDVRMRTPGLAIRFLGGVANIGPGMAQFARHANVPIFLTITVRTGWTQHSLRVHPPITPDPAVDKHQDLQRMTQQALTLIEETIRADPGQWFWYNQRWVLEPVPSMGSPENDVDSAPRSR